MANSGAPSPAINGPAAVASLNEQIEKFNANRIPPMGVSPIDQRVSRVEYDAQRDQVTSFDQDGNVFLVLERQPDGRFKAVLEVPFHEPVDLRADGRHAWGHVLAEFYLEKGTF